MEETLKYLIVGGNVCGVGTEADLVNEAATYDEDYEILDEDELPLDLQEAAHKMRELGIGALSTDGEDEYADDSEEGGILSPLSPSLNTMEEQEIEGGNGSEQEQEVPVEVPAAPESAPAEDVTSEPIVETPVEEEDEEEAPAENETTDDSSGGEETEPAAESGEETV